MPVVEPWVNEEKLGQLLAEQTESETLDYKETCDLTAKADEVELAKDIGAMQIAGGYIVIGASSHGRLTGRFTPALAAHVDEARLRKMMAKYIPEPFTLLAACHEVKGHPVAVIYVGPHRDCFAIFERDGIYDRPVGKPKTVFRKGEVFARHGSSSERWRQADIDAIRRCLVDREKEAWRRELSADIESMGLGRRAQLLVSGPAANLTWKLDDATFQAAVVELLRRRDRIPLQLLSQHAAADAWALVASGDRAELSTLLNRYAGLVALGVSLGNRWLVGLGLEATGQVYDLGFRNQGSAPSQIPDAELWLLVIERVFAVGGLAVRKADWQTVRALALRAPGPPSERQYYPTWIRHSLTMAARSGLFQGEDNGRKIELSLLSLALQVVRTEPALRADVDEDDEALLNSLCQFDALASIAAMGAEKSFDPRVFYTSFSRFYSRRTEPTISRLLKDKGMRSILFPLDDDQLSAALRALNAMASSEALRISGWDGYSNRDIVSFLAEHPQ